MDSLDSKAVFFDANGTIVGGEPSLWTFEFTGNNTCRLKYGNQYVEVVESSSNEALGWVSADYCLNNLRLSSNGTVFTISESGGKVRLSYNGRSITNVLSNPYYGDSRRLFAMSNNNTGASLFTLCDTTHDYDEFKATKISAADLQENKQIVIYHKDANGDLYALADDGTYVQITESGESIYWRSLESGKNILWNMTITSSTSGYYDFTSVANPDIHISPSVTDETVMDTKYVGVTLDGRQNGTYTSTIKAWDDPYYSWVGIEKNGNVATQVLGAGDEFMFAEYSPFTVGTPQTVDTVDSSTLGIKIRMFDYSGDSFISYSGTTDPDNRLYGMRYAVNGDISTENDYVPGQTSGLVSENLVNGLPVSEGKMSMLFAPGTSTYNVSGKSFTKTDKGLANHLFIQSVYDETGYFHYSSAENYAYYTGNNFNVYQQVASPTINPRNDQQYFFHGHFMPYNDINMAVTHDAILYDQNGNPLNVTDPRTYEMVYGIQGTPNFFTGMSMEADFAQLEDGKDKNGNDVIFMFTGDDDMWVFIDGVRVLDLGGIHEALSGTINFATGEVNVNGDTSHDLYWFYQQAGKENTVKWKDSPSGHKIFADFTTHTFNMFYMERGAGASNLDLHFNLPVVKAGSFAVAKKLSEPAQTDYANVQFAYRAYLTDGTVLKPGVSEFVGITYEGTNTAVMMDNNGVFYLKPGEAATIQLANRDVSYYVEELGVNTDMYSTVNILEDETGPSMIATTTYEGYPLPSDYVGETYKVARSLTETVANRGRVTYENTPSSKNLNELHITKKVINAKGEEIFPDVNTTFEFKVFLEGTNGELGPYMQDDYYLKKIGDDGFTHYYDITASGLVDAGYLDGNTFHALQTYIYYNTEMDGSGKPVPHTVNAGSTISVGAEGYELPVCGNSGQNGSIAKIPAGYTVVIKNLLAGTEFYVEERLLSPRYYPENYEYVGKEVVEGTAIVPGNLDTTAVQDSNNKPTTPADGILKDNTDGEVIITNLQTQKTDVTIQKSWNWSDEDKQKFDNKEIVSWKTTFKLQYREVLESGTPDMSSNVQALWGYVYEGESVKQITIEQSNITDDLSASGTGSFGDFPMYKLHSNGSIYRLVYSVEEAEYTITYSDGTFKTWAKGTSPGFVEHYSPVYGDDAGDIDDEYLISLTNVPSAMTEQNTISMGIQKTWEGDNGGTISENSANYAKFQLKRYYHEEYLNLSNFNINNVVSVTVDLGNGIKSVLEVPQGAPVYITADVKSAGSVDLTFIKNGTTDSRTLQYNPSNTGHSTHTDALDGPVVFVYSDVIIANEDQTWVLQTPAGSNAYKEILGGVEGIRPASFDDNDPGVGISPDVTGEIFDSSFRSDMLGQEFTLNNGNGWEKSWDRLPQIVEVKTKGKGNNGGEGNYLTTIVYSYYFEETGCNPSSYYAVFRDKNSGEQYGDITARVEASGLTIEAINKRAPETKMYKVDVSKLSGNISAIDPDHDLLKGATFKIRKYKNFADPESDTDTVEEVDTSWGANGEKEATYALVGSDNGQFVVDGLGPGYYEIEEITYPAGYIQVVKNPRFQVELDTTTETLSIVPWNSETIGIIPTMNNNPNIIVVGNTPGAALPNTGGPGTEMIRHLGVLLLAMACAGLVMRRRKTGEA